MSLNQIQLVIACAGILNGLVVSIFLLLTKSGNRIANRLLASLILAALFKISFAFVISGYEVSYETYFMVYIVAMAGYYAIAPLLWLYFKVVTSKEQRFNPVDVIHLLPSAYILLIPHLNLHHFILSLWLAQVQIFAYLILASIQLRKLSKNQELKPLRGEYTVLRNVLIAVVLFWIDVFFIMSMEFRTPYVLELCVLFSLIVYILVFSAIKQVWITRASVPIQEHSYLNSCLNEQEAQSIISELENLMESERFFENPDITLPKLARHIGVSPHKLSEIINRQKGVNFTEYINKYRVDRVKELLLDPNYSHFKIAGIAFEAGFNTLSTFNLAFKKCTGLTPTEFKKQLQLQSA